MTGTALMMCPSVVTKRRTRCDVASHKVRRSAALR
jgi:hypothetical protein